MGAPNDTWTVGDAYERYVGRWSERVAAPFLDGLDVGPGGRWLDVGCGTGALTRAILARRSPESVLGVDPSPGFLAVAADRVRDPRAAFVRGTATELPVGPATADAAVAALVLNFVPSATEALRAMASATRPGGIVSGYVWDYADRMQMIRRFWDATVALDPAAAALDEARRFPLCSGDALGAAFRDAGLDAVEVRAIEVPTVFDDFEAYWSPFLGGQGPAPTYCASLGASARDALRERLRAELPAGADGRIALVARAWASVGIVPG